MLRMYLLILLFICGAATAAGVDTDGDWLPDSHEFLTYGTDPNNWDTDTDTDTDGDGTGDFYELFLGFDTNDPTDVGSDADGDGLTALREVAT